MSQGGEPIGTVAVLLANATGTFGSAQVWHLDRSDLPGTARSTDRFGSSLVVGDLTGDGITDVAVGAPWRRVGSAADAGAAHVIVGSSSGPSGSAVEISQSAGTVPGSPELADVFGSSLAAGHYSSATADWLAVGAPGEDLGTTTAAGSVTLLPGSPSGPDVGAARVLSQDTSGILGAAEDHDSWGTLDGAGVAQWPALPASMVGRVVTVLPTSAKVLALTFDGGASNAGVASILATLADQQVAATFFLSGAFARSYPASVRAIAAARHRIGNHSDTHPDMTTLTLSAQADQVRRAEATVRPLAGQTTHPWFRFPFGASSASTIANANAQGFSAIGWTVDTLGWQGTSGGRSVASVVNRVVSTARPGQIVLMHVGANPDDGTTLDALALPTLIVRLRAMGYSFVTVDSALR